jgi:predicted porin
MQPYLTESEPDLGDSLPPSDSHTRNSPSCVGTSLGPNVAVQTVAGSPQGGSSMKLSGYFTFVVLAFGSVLSTSAQQNPTQVTVSSVVTCVSTGDQRQHCSANTSAGVVMLRQSSETNCLLGRNWGYDAQGVWVTEGCGGEFATGSTSRSVAVPVEANAYVEPADQKAEMATATTGVNPKVQYFGMLNPYGSLRTIVGISDAGAQVQDDASRIGINFTTFGAIKVFGTAEWGVNLVQSETTFNAGATTASGFGVINQATQPVFGARLGFVGVDFGAFGRIAFGKQNSTHYDITDYTTDRFNVFGGQSTATYVAGTDGGQSGTGRADQVILYHIKFAKIFDFGAQGQLRSGATSQAFNGFGFSLQATVLPGLKIGGAYNKTYFNPEFTRVIFNGGGTDYWTIGAKGDWRNLEWGAVYVRQSNGDIAFVPDPAGGPEPIAIGFSADGVELYSRLKFGKFAAVFGFDDYIPRDLSPFINSNFKTRYGILGAEWHFSKAGYAFFETSLGDSVDAQGKNVSDAAALGFRYDFSWKTPHTE